MDERVLIERIKDAARSAGRIMKGAVCPKIMEKSGHANFVTETDERIQQFLIGALSDILPDAAFLGEEDGQDEYTEKMGKGYVFVIDPIDGTSNFIFEYHPSVVSIGLLHDGRPYMGIVYNPYDDMLFEAIAGKGAYMNGERIISSEAGLSDSLVTFGTAPYYAELRDETFRIAKSLMGKCVDIRRSGTAAWDMCCVAMGRCALYFELKIQIWDYAAAALIASEAGCKVTDIKGRPLSYEGASSALCRARGVKDIPFDITGED
ncbi:MAG: inositol monophosphatase [Lachnospiraceae bacterium]|nr:inositol monophosphatase [Lachnospiraceae bacterium]